MVIPMESQADSVLETKGRYLRFDTISYSLPHEKALHSWILKADAIMFIG